MEKLWIFIKRNGSDYISSILTTTLSSTLEGDNTSIEAYLVDDGVRKHMEPSIDAMLGNGPHQFGAMVQLAPCKNAYRWKTKGLCICLVIWKDQQQATAG